METERIAETARVRGEIEPWRQAAEEERQRRNLAEVEKLISAWKRKRLRGGILREHKRSLHYVKPSDARREKLRAGARRRQRVLATAVKHRCNRNFWRPLNAQTAREGENITSFGEEENGHGLQR